MPRWHTPCTLHRLTLAAVSSATEVSARAWVLGVKKKSMPCNGVVVGSGVVGWVKRQGRLGGETDGPAGCQGEEAWLSEAAGHVWGSSLCWGLEE